MPCHTSAKDKQFAGGLKLDTPFGAIYLAQHHAPIPTPASAAGPTRISRTRSMPAFAPDGSYLYPVMTYDAFTLITEDDLKALWAYFRSIPAIKQQNRGQRARIPVRHPPHADAVALAVLHRGYYSKIQPRVHSGTAAPIWSRRLAHCGDCHTPRNFMGATIASKWLQGAQIDQWYAPRHHRRGAAAKRQQMGQGAPRGLPAQGRRQQLDRHSGRCRRWCTTACRSCTEIRSRRDGDLSCSTCRPALKRRPGRSQRSSRPTSRRARPSSTPDNCASCHQADGKGIANHDPTAGRQPGNPGSQTVRHPGGCAAGRSGARRHYCDAELCGFARRSERGRPRQLRAHQLRQRGLPERHPSMVAAWRSTLSLPVYASASARTFDCPGVGQGGSASFDPSVIAGLGRELSQRSVSYAQLVADYQAKNPKAGLTDIVNNLIAAYCPVVRCQSRRCRTKARAGRWPGSSARSHPMSPA